ncbi:MAG: CocE/NonD family hydrolase, partial [Anaerolineales bacterium]|nr:CocE/NonD family hydrolase [Anaerolineales bacterium]
GDSGLTIGEVSPYALRAAIESSHTPMYVWIGWLDAGTVDGALSRYLTFSNPQKLVIGPWSHGGAHHTDPFLPPDTPTAPTREEQTQMLVDFFDLYLKEGASETPERSIRYYTLGEGVWKTTQTWPPEGFKPQRWYFGPGGTLSLNAPQDKGDADRYRVDFTASTGGATRWHTQLGGYDVVYPDRAEEDLKLLTYTSAPLETDVEITGSPIITLYVASTTTSDNAFHVYLEDVAPDGRVTYITEGILRAVHRKISDETPPYVQLGPYHSYLRADALPMIPNEVAEISFNLYATSVLIQKGHSIRIALAGHDASVFSRYPAEGTPIWRVQRNQLYPSSILLPVLARP